MNLQSNLSAAIPLLEQGQRVNFLKRRYHVVSVVKGPEGYTFHDGLPVCKEPQPDAAGLVRLAKRRGFHSWYQDGSN